MLANWNIDVTTKPTDARLPPAQCRSSATPVGRWRPNGDHLLPGPRLVQKRSLDHRRPDGTPDNVQHCIGFRTIIVSGCESHQIGWRRRTYAIDSTRFIKMWRVWIILMLSSSLDPRPFDDNYNYYITVCKYCVSVTHSHSAGGRNAPEFYCHYHWWLCRSCTQSVVTNGNANKIRAHFSHKHNTSVWRTHSLTDG